MGSELLNTHAVPGVRARIVEAMKGWLVKSPSRDTRINYECDLKQFLAFAAVPADQPEALAAIRPHHVAKWRDKLLADGLTNCSIRRKLTVLRSLFSYLQTYGYVGANPAHSDFVTAPPVPRDGKTVGLSPDDCRRLLDAPIVTITKKRKDESEQKITVPVGIRDRAMLAILAYTGCRVGELTRMKVGSYRQNGTHRIVEVYGKGGKERYIPLHVEAVERIETWLDAAGIRDDLSGALFRPAETPRGEGRDGFSARALSCRAVQALIKSYVARLKLDPNVTVHSLRVTALTTARERGSDIIDLQDFAGHSDPRTTLTYIRSRDRLSKSPAYVLKY